MSFGQSISALFADITGPVNTAIFLMQEARHFADVSNNPDLGRRLAHGIASLQRSQQAVGELVRIKQRLEQEARDLASVTTRIQSEVR